MEKTRDLFLQEKLPFTHNVKPYAKILTKLEAARAGKILGKDPDAGKWVLFFRYIAYEDGFLSTETLARLEKAKAFVPKPQSSDLIF